MSRTRRSAVAKSQRAGGNSHAVFLMDESNRGEVIFPMSQNQTVKSRNTRNITASNTTTAILGGTVESHEKILIQPFTSQFRKRRLTTALKQSSNSEIRQQQHNQQSSYEGNIFLTSRKLIPIHNGSSFSRRQEILSRCKSKRQNRNQYQHLSVYPHTRNLYIDEKNSQVSQSLAFTRTKFENNFDIEQPDTGSQSNKHKQYLHIPMISYNSVGDSMIYQDDNNYHSQESGDLFNGSSAHMKYIPVLSTGSLESSMLVGIPPYQSNK